MRKATAFGAITAFLLVASSSALANSWVLLSDDEAALMSQNDSDVVAGAKFVGPGPDVFASYFSVVGSDLCGGKVHDPIGSSTGHGSIRLEGLPPIASVTRCDSEGSLTYPETEDGMRILAMHFAGGRVNLASSSGKPLAYFDASNLMDCMVSAMNIRLKRGT